MNSSPFSARCCHRKHAAWVAAQITKTDACVNKMHPRECGDHASEYSSVTSIKQTWLQADASSLS
jgi:hypothetical protein